VTPDSDAREDAADVPGLDDAVEARDAGGLGGGAGGPDEDSELGGGDGHPDGLVELVVGKPAAGGGCVARLPDGRVAFVRHAIPGERVLARITEEARSYVRADAVTIGEAAPSRVTPPCRHAGPGRCGGCDWQHISLPMQREMKASLVMEHLQRIAGVELAVAVEAVPGDDHGLAWRTRARYAVLPRGRLGFHRYRSHEVQPVDHCPIAGPGIAGLAPEQMTWTGAEAVEIFAPDAEGELTVMVDSRRGARVQVPRFDGGLVVDGRTMREPRELQLNVLDHRFAVSGGVFWQVHVGAPVTLGRALIDLAEPRPGESVADLYAGVGLFTALLADAVGETGHVLAVEQDARAAEDAYRNVVRSPHVDVLCARVTPELVTRELRATSLAVLDPPRQGAGQQVAAALAGLGRLRRIVYVACDAASFARDLRVLLDSGWTLTALRAFDLFPMTEHVELMAVIDAPRVTSGDR
jgi:tRNA/tmRNA/rRNA uracil-C5-methylase (TrmA/RlmC/RlmD family)